MVCTNKFSDYCIQQSCLVDSTQPYTNYNANHVFRKLLFMLITASKTTVGVYYLWS